MRLLLSLLDFCLLNLCLITYSQNWNLINPDIRYNYVKHNDLFISTTIWIDSVKTNGDDDTIYFLNRIIIDCDTCEKWDYNNVPKFAFYNQPQFMQKIVIKTDSNYSFSFPNFFSIYHKANLGYSWIFDTLNNITATIINKTEKEIFNRADSIKTIQLSTGDTIIISKNYGIFRFDDIFENNKYSLVGINNLLGDSVPDFFDFFDFSIGDIFEFKGDYQDDVGYGHYNFIKKYFIISKVINNDTLVYGVHYKYFSQEFTDPPFQFPLNPYRISYDTNWMFINAPNHPTNRFNNELIQYSDILNYEPSEYSNYVDYTYLRCYLDSKNIYSKSLGSFENNDFMSIVDTSQYILERHISGPWDEYEIRYKVGLGTVYYDNQGFEWWRKEELVAYAKGNDTVGVFTEDSFFSNIQENNFSESLVIYPNPSNNIVYVKIPNGCLISKIRILNLNGLVIRTSHNKSNISVEDLEPSLYIIEIVSGNLISRHILMVNE